MIVLNADFIFSLWINSVFSYTQIMLGVLCFPKSNAYSFYYFFSLVMMCVGPIYSIERNTFGPDYTLSRLI